MSNLPRNSAASDMLYGIVVGGHDADPAPDLSGGLRVFFPGIHGPGVKPEHLNFSPRIMSPTKETQQRFPGGLDPGTLVLARKDTGSSYCQILGIANDTHQSDQRLEGNIDLLKYIDNFMATTIRVQLPPQIKQVMENGVLVRNIAEKGKHSHNVLRGLPTHGAIYNLLGAVVPSVNNVATAKQPYNNLMNSSLLSAIPGTIMTLGSMFSSLSSSGQLKNMLKNLPPAIGQSLNSISTLMQSIEVSSEFGFQIGGRVHETTFLNNAVSLLSQVTNLSDVVNVLSRLTNDTTLFGHENLQNGKVSISSQFGPMTLSISPTGSISSIIPKETQQIIDMVTKSFNMFKGVSPDKNLFGDSSKNIFNMLNQIQTKSFTVAKTLLEKVNTSSTAEIFTEMKNKTLNGTNPLALL